MNFHVGQDEIIKQYPFGGTINILDNTIILENCGFFLLREWFETRNSVETEE